MSDLLTALGIVIGLVLLWTGIRRIEISSFRKSVLSLLEVAALIAGTFLLGWLGWLIFAVVNLVGLLVWSLYLAAQKQTHLIYASTQSGTSKDEMYRLHKRLWNGDKAFRILGPIETARLVSLLAQRARSPEEIEEMALPIAMLSVTHSSDLDWLVNGFDSILRLHGEPATASMRLADTLSAGTKESAATFEEMVEAMRTAVTPDADETAA